MSDETKKIEIFARFDGHFLVTPKELEELRKAVEAEDLHAMRGLLKKAEKSIDSSSGYITNDGEDQLEFLEQMEF